MTFKMLFPTFLAKKYKTPKGHRTHELTTQIQIAKYIWAG